MISGMSAAARPMRYRGLRNVKLSMVGSHAQGLTAGQVIAQKQVEPLVRLRHHVVDAGRAAAPAEGVDELAELLEVGVAEGAGVAGDLAGGLHVLDAGDVVEGEADLG